MMLGYESNLEDVLKKTIKELKTVRKVSDNFEKLELEIETLQWILEIKKIVKNDMHTLQRVILHRINKLNTELENKDRLDKHLTLYGIEVLKPCLFLLNLDIEKRNIKTR